MPGSEEDFVPLLFTTESTLILKSFCLRKLNSQLHLLVEEKLNLMKSLGMMKNRLEKDVIKSVLIGLRTRQLQGEVVWFSRLNSGSIHGGGYHIKLCDQGTPDIIVAVRHNQGAKLLFLECKREGINKLEPEQEYFAP